MLFSICRGLHTSRPLLLRGHRSARLPPTISALTPPSSVAPTLNPVTPTTSFSFETAPQRRASKSPRGDPTLVALAIPTDTLDSDDGGGSSSDEEDELNPATDERELMAEEGGVEDVEGGFALAEEAIKSTCAVETLVVGGYDPLHPGIPWVRVPMAEGEGNASLTLPVPVSPLRANGRWHWHCWSSSGETLGLSTTVHLLAPFLPPHQDPPSSTFKGLVVPKTLEQTLAITQLSSRFKSRLKEGGGGGSTPQSSNAPTIPLPSPIQDPSGLPVYFQVRVLKGLFSSELSGAFSGTPRDLAHLFVDIHSMKSGPMGDLRAVRAARPPVVVDSWEVGGGNGEEEEEEEGEGEKGGGGGGEKRRGGRRVFGIEYESPSGSVAPLGLQGQRPEWGGVGGSTAASPVVSRRDEVRKAREALELEYGGEGGERMMEVRKDKRGGALLTHLVTMRHVVTIVCDLDRDIAYELSVGAPVDAWDELWGGVGGGEGEGDGNKGWPTPKELGLRGFGLKGMLENATIG